MDVGGALTLNGLSPHHCHSNRHPTNGVTPTYSYSRDVDIDGPSTPTLLRINVIGSLHKNIKAVSGFRNLGQMDMRRGNRT